MSPPVPFAVDLTGNALTAPLPKPFLKAACLASADQPFKFNMYFRSDPYVRPPAAHVPGGRGWFVFSDNSQLEDWALQYRFAVGKRSYSGRDRQVNMCGGSSWAVALGLILGAYAGGWLLLLLLLNWRRRRRRQARRQAALEGKPLPEGPRWAARLQLTCAKLPVRNALQALRVVFIFVDLALDVAVWRWMYAADGYVAACVVLLFFAALAQAVVGGVVYFQAFPRCGARCCGALLAPLLVPVAAFAAPVMACANLRKPRSSPLQWAKYLELLEYCFVLLHAPAAIVVQAAVYAAENELANSMYVDHWLFRLSLLASVTDVLASLTKAVAHRDGPAAKLGRVFHGVDRPDEMDVYLISKTEQKQHQADDDDLDESAAEGCSSTPAANGGCFGGGSGGAGGGGCFHSPAAATRATPSRSSGPSAMSSGRKGAPLTPPHLLQQQVKNSSLRRFSVDDSFGLTVRDGPVADVELETPGEDHDVDDDDNDDQYSRRRYSSKSASKVGVASLMPWRMTYSTPRPRSGGSSSSSSSGGPRTHSHSLRPSPTSSAGRSPLQNVQEVAYATGSSPIAPPEQRHVARGGKSRLSRATLEY